MSDLNLSKEEKERIVNERIEQIRKKNELLKKRYEEVQTDKMVFELQKKKDRAEGVDKDISYGGRLESDRAEDVWKGRGRGRARTINDDRQERSVGRQANNVAYEAWRAERERIDSERLNRQKTTDGSWKREWDQNKIVAEDDKGDRRAPAGDEAYYENRRAPRNQKLGDFIPRQRNGDRAGDSRSFYRQRPRSGHDEWRTSNEKNPQSANGDEDWDSAVNRTFGNGERKFPRSPQDTERKPDGRRQNRGHAIQGQRYDRPLKGRFDKSVSPRKPEGRSRENEEAQSEKPERKVNHRPVDLRAKLDAIRAKKSQEATALTESQPLPQFDLKSPVRSVEVTGDSLRVVIPNEIVASSPQAPTSPPVEHTSLTEQPSSLMLEGEFFEDDYFHEHIGDSFEDNSKSWETASSENGYTDAEEETSARSAVPDLEPYKSADERIVESSTNASFASAEGEAEESADRKCEDLNLIFSAKTMMLNTFEVYQNAEWEVLEYGDLIGLKSAGVCFAWGAHADEDIQTLQHFMEAPFIYHYTKGEFAPSVEFPRVSSFEMAIKLADFHQAFYVENLVVQLDNDEDKIQKFTNVVACCFNLNPDQVWSLLKYIQEDYILAHLNGELVGGLLLTIIGDSSIVYYNSVLPKFRGQNISKALMAEAIKVAKEKGAKEMVLMATPLGEPVYKALGFKYIREWTRVIIPPISEKKEADEEPRDRKQIEPQDEGKSSAETQEDKPSNQLELSASPLKETMTEAELRQPVSGDSDMASRSEDINLYRMSIAVADIVETDGDSVISKYGPWCCVYKPKTLEGVEKVYKRFYPIYLDVHFRPDSVPEWAKRWSFSKRYSMACNLGVEVEENSNFVTVKVETDEHFKLCAQISADNFGFGSAFLESLEELFRKAVGRGATVLNAFEESEPAGCGIMEYVRDMAVVYFFSVNAQFRRKGVGTQLIRRFVTVAKNKGLREAVLLAEGDIARRLYEKAGFSVFDTWNVNKYEPSSDEPSRYPDYIDLDCSATEE